MLTKKLDLFCKTITKTCSTNYDYGQIQIKSFQGWWKKKTDILSGPLALSIDPSGRFVSATTYFAEVDKMRYR